MMWHPLVLNQLNSINKSVSITCLYLIWKVTDILTGISRLSSATVGLCQPSAATRRPSQ
jgi:hypothetical protein